MDFDFPKNAEVPPRRFTKDNYKITMKNGSKRSWLLYSVSTDAVFCFSRLLFSKRDNALSTHGYCAWKNLAHHLKEHEYTKAHSESMKKWHDLQKRLPTQTAIDQTYQNLMQLEIEHQKAVTQSHSHYLSPEQNQALRGTSNVPFDDRIRNGNFLSLVELMGQFDSVLNEHLKRIKNKEMKVHYLSPTIQNEIINLVGEKIIEEIMRRVKLANYYSVIMDCTPDRSHKEQLSLVLRIVNCETSAGAAISEHFVGFFDVKGQLR